MRLDPIQVECYAGHKADESPRRFFLRGEWLEIMEILDRWYEAGGNPEWSAANYFKVLAGDGRQHLLKHDHESEEWFLARSW